MNGLTFDWMFVGKEYYCVIKNFSLPLLTYKGKNL